MKYYNCVHSFPRLRCADQTQPGRFLQVRTDLGEAGGPPSLSHTISFQNVLSTDNVRRKFIAILTAVAADITLKRLPETMAAHVDGEHDVIQEEHAAVLATEGAHGPPVSVHHPEGLSGGGGGRRGGTRGGGGENGRVGARVASLLPLLFFGVAGTRSSSSPVVQQESRRRNAAAVVVEEVMVVVVVVVVKVRRQSGAAVRLVMHALRVRGVLAAVARRGCVAAACGQVLVALGGLSSSGAGGPGSGPRTVQPRP